MIKCPQITGNTEVVFFIFWHILGVVQCNAFYSREKAQKIYKTVTTACTMVKNCDSTYTNLYFNTETGEYETLLLKHLEYMYMSSGKILVFSITYLVLFIFTYLRSKFDIPFPNSGDACI